MKYLPPSLHAIFLRYRTVISYIFPVLLGIAVMIAGTLYWQMTQISHTLTKQTLSHNQITMQLAQTRKQLDILQHEDQKVRNDTLQKEIADIQKTYKKALITYESLLALQAVSKNTDELEKLLAKSLSELSRRNYATASSDLDVLTAKISAENKKVADSFVVPQNIPQSNAAPGNGFSRQQVTADVGTFMVDLIAGDLGSTRVVVDTASDNDCHDNCPVLPLGDYVARNGGYAGINGSYFCPASYPSCAGKTNSFDLLVMNKNKQYFNSDNNVYSTNPAVIFQGGSVRFVSQALQWGRDTGVDGVLSNFPLLVLGGNITYEDGTDPKMTGKGPRTFVANKGNTVYIGIVYNADMRQSAHVLKALGMDNAINLDEGGSTALWYGGGYKAGPGRAVPNAIVFIRK